MAHPIHPNGAHPPGKHILHNGVVAPSATGAATVITADSVTVSSTSSSSRHVSGRVMHMITAVANALMLHDSGHVHAFGVTASAGSSAQLTHTEAVPIGAGGTSGMLSPPGTSTVGEMMSDGILVEGEGALVKEEGKEGDLDCKRGDLVVVQSEGERGIISTPTESVEGEGERDVIEHSHEHTVAPIPVHSQSRGPSPRGSITEQVLSLVQAATTASMASLNVVHTRRESHGHNNPSDEVMEASFVAYITSPTPSTVINNNGVVLEGDANSGGSLSLLMENDVVIKGHGPLQHLHHHLHNHTHDEGHHHREEREEDLHPHHHYLSHNQVLPVVSNNTGSRPPSK